MKPFAQQQSLLQDPNFPDLAVIICDQRASTNLMKPMCQGATASNRGKGERPMEMEVQR